MAEGFYENSDMECKFGEDAAAAFAGVVEGATAGRCFAAGNKMHE